MNRRRRCTLIAALSLATVAGGGVPSALAAGPGDSQYQDPFPATQTQPSKNSKSSSGSNAASTTASNNAAPLTAAPPAQSTGSTTASQTSAHSSSSGRRLAATGADALLVALTGLGMLLAGIGLRLREPGA